MKFFLIMAVLLSSCGTSPTLVKLKLQFPASLAKNSPRYLRFLARIDHYRLTLVEEAGNEWVEEIPSFSNPDGLVIPTPAGNSGPATVFFSALVQGNEALAGKGKIQPGKTEVKVKLTLKVPITAFD